MNKLSMGARVFQIHSSDGGTRPKSYVIKFVGVVSSLDKENKNIRFGYTLLPEILSESFLKPNVEGLSRYFTEPPVFRKTKVKGLYEVPADDLLLHVNTYKSPW